MDKKRGLDYRMKSENVKNREDFILFLKDFDKEFQENIKQNKNKFLGGTSKWDNWSAGNFLESIAAWLEDSGKYKKKSLNWRDLANILESGKIYE